MFCKNCGKELKDGASFCPYCGTKTPAGKTAGQQAQGAQYQMAGQAYGQNPYPQAGPDFNMIPEEYRPISMWGYFGYTILFNLPFIGWILAIVFSFAPSNQNVKNFARSYFCFTIIVIIILLIALATGGLAAVISSLG